MEKKKVFKVAHAEPGDFSLDYIILPFGEFYEKTKGLLSAKSGDVLRFYNGPEVPIERVMTIACDAICDFLCKMRYGVTWDVVLRKWQSYARMEGHGKEILSTEKCILVVYGKSIV